MTWVNVTLNEYYDPDALEPAKAAKMSFDLTADADKFYDDFTRQFFSANADGVLLVSELQREEALAQCKQASKWRRSKPCGSSAWPTSARTLKR